MESISATGYTTSRVYTTSSLSGSSSSTAAYAAAPLRSSHHLVPSASKIRRQPLALPSPACRAHRRGFRNPSHGGADETRGDRRSLVVSASSRRSRGWDDAGEESRRSDEVQRMLVDIVRLQMGEVRMNSLVEERSARLRRIARDSHEQLDRIADRTMKGVDDLSDRVLRQLDAGAYAIERDLEKARQEMEAQQKDFEEFERRVYSSRNEGLFFKNLYSPSSSSSSLSSRRRRPLSRRPSSSSSSSAPPSSPAFRQSRAAKSRTAAAATAMSATAAEAALLENSPASSSSSGSSGGAGGLRSNGVLISDRINTRDGDEGLWDDACDGEVEQEGRAEGGVSMYRRILHAGISLVLVSFLWSSTTAFVSGHTMRFSKVAAYTAILSAMLLQLKFEKEITGEDNVEESDQEEEMTALLRDLRGSRKPLLDLEGPAVADIMGFSIQASNISYKASEKDIYEFFSFSGEITGIETKTDLKKGQVAYVTFADERALETALLLTGAVIVDEPIIVEVAEGYEPPQRASHVAQEVQRAVSAQSPAKSGVPSFTAPDIKSAEGVVASLLASGYILGKDAASKAKEFDTKHDLSRTAAIQVAALKERTVETAATLDKKYAISQKFSETKETVARSWTSVDEQYKVSQTARGAAAAAEASISEAGQYLMKNQYVASSASWLAGAFGKLGEIVGEVKQQTLQKVHQAEEERGEVPTVSVDGGSKTAPGGYSAVSGAAGYDDDKPGSAAGAAAAGAGGGVTAGTTGSGGGALDHGPPLFASSDAAAAGPVASAPAPAPTPAPVGSLMDDVFSPGPAAAPTAVSSAPAVSASPAKLHTEEPPLF
ncbi:unnamed protein product [Closterium sp. Yama58-4]|nr:unnamed protein product [Closterium sp. Yama58-4]